MPEADLKELRDQFEYDTNEWREIRQEGRTDMLCIAGRIWEAIDPQGLQQRQKVNRPALNFDELSQYVNQVINDIRQNKRAIKVTAMPPTGGVAPQDTDQLEAEARFRANLIRQIEYRSNAPRDAYTVMFENAVQRSYGACRVVPAWVDREHTAQELLIKPIYNPDQLTIDADSQCPDGADMKHAFYHEWWPTADFKRRWKHAKTGNLFDKALSTLSRSPQWARQGRVLVSERWIKRDDGSIVQQLTNGYDFLEDEKPWPGQHLPFVICLGKVLYLDSGEGSKRVIHSLVRLARDPAMLVSYYRTTEAELVGLTPKFPYFVRQGSLDPIQLANLAKSLHEPVPVIEVKASVDGMPAGAPPEFPSRQPYEPAIAPLEMGAESARRAVQSAMGTNFLPTDAQNRNQKSGKALGKIETASQRGSYHFVDHFEGSVSRVGVILNDLLDYYYDSARDVTVRKPDETPEIVRINDPQAQGSISLTKAGQFDVTISTGPSFDSEREAASDFADVLVGISPQIFQLLGPLIVKLKNLGPIGDEMAELLEAVQPPEIRQAKAAKNDPQAAARELMATKAELQKVMQAAGAMQQALETEQAKQQATVARAEIDKRTELEKAQIQRDTQVELERLKAATQIRIAEINASIKGYTVEAEHRAAHEAQALGAAVDADEAERGRMHDAAMLEREHQQALEAAEQGAAADAAMQREQMAGQMEMQAMNQPPDAGGGAGV